jgi:hypothetical protein
MSDALTIEQTTGPKRSMIFRGPGGGIYQPLGLPMTMREKTEWLPGNPVAIQQILGRTLEPIVLRGMWKDVRLGANNETSGVDLLNFPPLSPGAVPQSSVASGSSFVGTNAFPARQPARLARVVHDAVALIISEGQQVRLAWDQYVRFGVFTRFDPRFLRIHDVEFELEFKPSGDTDSPAIKRKINLNVLATATGLQALMKGILDVLAKFANIKQPNGFLSKVGNSMAALVGLVEAIVAALGSAGQIISAPQNVLGTIKSALYQIKLLVQGLLSNFASITSAAGEASQVGEADAVAIAALIQQQLRSRLVELASFAAEQQRLADLFETDEILATFVAPSLTSLYDVARDKYGDASQWVRISNYNGFFSQTVARGTLVRVPKI